MRERAAPACSAANRCPYLPEARESRRVAREASEERWLPPDFSKCESAVQGLRKTLLRRPWNPRCAKCGVRHEDIEFSTCRFWEAWVV